MADIWKNQISPYPENLMSFSTSQASMIERLSTTKIAFVTDTEELRSLVNIECRLHIAKDRAYGTSLAFPVPKNAPYKKDFDSQ